MTEHDWAAEHCVQWHDGLLSAADRTRVDSHLQSCAVCAALYADAQTALAACELLAEGAPEPPEELVHAIMREIENSPSRRPLLRLPTIPAIGAALCAAAVLVLTFVVPREHTTSVPSTHQPGVSTFSEANFDDTLIRNSVGSVFKLIEGGAGAVLLLVFAAASAASLAWWWQTKSRGAKYACFISSCALLCLGAARLLIGLFFGVDYE